MLTPLLMLAAGIALAAWNLWQRRGRSPAARAWSRGVQGDWTRRSVLVVRPLIALVLVLGAVVAWRDDGPLVVALGAAIGGCLLLLGAFLVLPIPVPGFLQPGWCRQGRARGRAHAG